MDEFDADIGAEWTIEQLGALFSPIDQLTLTDSNQDMIAIHRYMSDTIAVTPKARELKDQFIRWWNGLTWNERNLSTAAFDEARNRMGRFQLENTTSAEQRAGVQRVLSTGITTEEMEGKGRRTTSDGFIPDAPSQDSEKPFLPSWFKAGAGIALLAGTALGIAKIVGGFNPLALAARLGK